MPTRTGDHRIPEVGPVSDPPHADAHAGDLVARPLEQGVRAVVVGAGPLSANIASTRPPRDDQRNAQHQRSNANTNAKNQRHEGELKRENTARPARKRVPQPTGRSGDSFATRPSQASRSIVRDGSPIAGETRRTANIRRGLRRHTPCRWRSLRSVVRTTKRGVSALLGNRHEPNP